MQSIIENWGIFLLHALLAMAILWPISSQRWRVSELMCASHLFLSSTLFILTLIAMPGASDAGPNTHYLTASALFNGSPIALLVTVLVSFIGYIVLKYAHRNLSDDPDNRRFLTGYLTTLLAVSVTVTTNHLVVFALGWIAISLSLHRLLLFYPERPRAKLAAHKKFLFARSAELLLIVAFVLLYLTHQTNDISVILSQYPQNEMTVSDQLVGVLLAAVALIKCAQLPLHGWLIQVVEAPTPVSALLHAGIINLGGFLLLTFAPLLGGAVIAQWLLLIVAGLSCVLASLVMMTRISIKVRLAWSTVAQMGLMLIECALGLYELALLHLVAHSCYKAHAFLASGETVSHYLRAQCADNALPGARHWLASAACIAIFASLGIAFTGTPTIVSPWILIGIATLTLLAYHFRSASLKSCMQALGLGGFALLAYLVLGNFIQGLTPVTFQAPGLLADVWVSGLFITLFLGFMFLQYAPKHRFAKQSFIALNAGFYLDEWATRITLRLWPISLPNSQNKKLASKHFPGKTVEVRYE